MKKLLLSLLLTVLIFTLSACGSSELKEELNRLNTLQNYSVFTTLEIGDETFSSVVRKDRDFLHFQSDFEQFIMAKLNDRYYVYSQPALGQWRREEIHRNDFFTDTNFVAPTEHLRASWFEYDEGIWRLKERYYNRFLRHPFFDEFEVDPIFMFFIEFSEDGAFWYLSYGLENEVVVLTAVFFDYGNTSIVVPNV